MSYYTGLLFNTVDLTAITNVKVSRVITETIPEVIIQTGKLVRRDGMKLYNKEYGAKQIVVEGYITSNTRDGFLSTRDTLLRYLEPSEATLRVPIIPQPREWTATVQNTVFSDTGGGYGTFTITFLASDPFGYDRDAVTLLNGTSITAATSSPSLLATIQGSYASPPTITVSLASVTGGTGKYIELTNQAGKSIKITRDWLSSDVLLINAKLKSCKVNGAEVDYTGTFWDLAVGDTSITYTDNFTTRTTSIVMIYKPRRL